MRQYFCETVAHDPETYFINTYCHCGKLNAKSQPKWYDKKNIQYI